jgi:predicted dehydrogenase
MHFLVVGCGSIGQRHIRNIKALGYRVSAYEIDRIKRDCVREKYGIQVFSSLDEALREKYSAALICTPTRMHVSIAIKIAKQRIHLFIEKPLSDSHASLEALSEIVKKNKLVALVACNTRFFPSFKLAKKLLEEKRIGKILSVRVQCGFYLPYWHPYEDYRTSYSANRKLGGGVILDDIHEIDSLYWFFGKVKEVFCLADKISNLEINTEDIAEITLRFKSGVVAQVHLDYLQRTYRRSYEFIGEKGIIVWDYRKQTVELFTKEANRKVVYEENINTDREKMFVDEIRHFVNCINGKEKSINGLDSAREILKIALICQKSAKKKGIIYL